MRLLPALLAVLLLLGAAPIAAQEVQVPLDDGGQVDAIDRALARRLGLLLDEYPTLHMARLFRLDEGGFVLEVSFERDGGTARQRVPMTADEVDTLRARVSRALAENAPDVTLDQDGRFLLLGAATLLGLGYYGWAVPAILDVDSGRGALATYMLTAGGSFLVPYLYTKSRPVTYGMANAGFWGATRGLSHGAYLVNTLVDEPSFRLGAGIAMAASLGEGLLGYTWARRTGMTAGRAHTIGNFGDFGTATAGGILLITQPSADQVAFGTLLAGGTAGLVTGARVAPSLPFTWGDAEIQRAAYFLGAAHGGVVFDWIFGDSATDDELRLLGGLFLAGSVGGVALAHRMLDEHDFSVGEGILVELGAVAGGLLGMGLGVLVGPEDPESTLLFTLGAAGADLGFLTLYRALSDNARDRAVAEGPRDHGGATDPPGNGRLELHIDPTAFLLLTPAVRGGFDRRWAGGDRGLPLVSFRYRF